MNTIADSFTCRKFSRAVALVLLILTPLTIPSTAIASSHCDTSAQNRWYALARSHEIANVNGTGAQAGWHEQNYDVYDYSYGTNRFAAAILWVLVDRNPNAWVETGYFRSQWCPGNCFFRARGENGSVTHINKLSIAPQGAFTWHEYRLVYNTSTGAWHTFIDGNHHGGYSHQSSGVRVDVGNEVTSNCTTIHMTYWGSPNPSSPFAFQYRTSWGQWTTWGHGATQSANPPFQQEWQHYSIYQRTWGP